MIGWEECFVCVYIFVCFVCIGFNFEGIMKGNMVVFELDVFL